METKNKITHEYMKKMGELMTQAVDSQEGLKALARAIAPPISMEIEKKEITSLL